jgi:hypothetical protein
MSQRVKGQETTLLVIIDGELRQRIDTIQNFDMEFELDLLEEGYIGEVANRFDSIFNGCKVEFTGHMTSREALDVADVIVGRAQRRTGGATRIDITVTLKFDNGDLPSVLFSDVFFETVPFNTGGRDEYVEFTLSGKCSNYQITN